MPAPWSVLSKLSLMGKVLLVVTPVVAALAYAVFRWFKVNFPVPSRAADRPLYLGPYVDLVEAMGVGVIVALLSLIIPLAVSEARDLFERYKESRLAYSRAKTAVIYLPDRVVGVDREKAFLIVEEAHRELHLAETFEKDIIGKRCLKWFEVPHLWVLYNYWQIVAVANVLRSCDKSMMENTEMLRDQLGRALKVVHDTFGTRGESCKPEEWVLKGSRVSSENALKREIDKSIRTGLEGRQPRLEAGGGEKAGGEAAEANGARSAPGDAL